MLAAAHTRVLMDIFRRQGCPVDLLYREPGNHMALGNLLPDSLPLIGVPQDISHGAARAAALVKVNPAIAYGIMVHLYTDNLTHCGEIENCGHYENSYALRLGEQWLERNGAQYDDIFRRISGKSAPYILHIVIEIASDIVVAQNKEVIDLITNTWRSIFDHSPELIASLGSNFEIEAEDLVENLRKFRSGDRPSADEIYSRAARTELFLGKFEPDLRAGDQFNADDRRRVTEMLILAEDMVRDKVEAFIAECARRILEHNRELGNFVSSLKT